MNRFHYLGIGEINIKIVSIAMGEKWFHYVD